MGARVALNGLQPGTLYYLQFQAKNEALGMYSQWSNIFELQTIFDIVPPMPVENLTWDPVGTAFKATWTPPIYSEDGTLCLDLAGYEVIIWAPADGAVPGVPVPDPNIKLTYKTISPNFDFSYEMNRSGFQWPRGKVVIEVRAYDITGNKSAPTVAVAQNPVPAQVQNFDAAGGVDQIDFSWTKNPDPPDGDIMFYRIRQGLTAPTVNTVVSEINDIKSSWTTIYTGLQYFSIVAVDVFYQESAVKSLDSASARSSLAVDTTNPGVPTSVATTSGIDVGSPDNNRAYIDVTWVKPVDTDLQDYIIRYSATNTNWQYMVVPAEDSAGAAIQTARIQNLVAGTSYYVAIQSVDFTANHSAWANSNNYPQSTPKDTVAPSTPAAPTVAANTMQIQVSHNLKKADGTTNLEADIAYLEVYASSTTSFTPATANKLGDMQVIAPGVTGTPVTAIQNFSIPASASSGSSQTWYAKVIAVDNAGNKSNASAQSSASVSLTGSTNIADAAITDAKIGTLSANKITAGTGLINDLTIKAILTMGDASNNGIIQSFDYINGGTTGWKIEKGAFTVNNGTIAARALRLQEGSENLMHPAYADFEFSPTWYATALATANGATASIDATQLRYNFQSLKVVGDVTANTTVYLSPTSNGYNIEVEGNTTYIVSCFVKQTSGSAKTVGLFTRESDADTVKTVNGSASIPTGVWTRVSGTITTNANTTKMLVYVTNVAASQTTYFDGFQVEKQMSGATTPSQWTPPSYTRIDGGQIRTGSIQSTAAADGVSGQPAWSINTAGGFQLGSGVVRGRLFVGPDNGVPDAASVVQSSVYTAFALGSGTGWIIRGDGYAEFNQVLVRGDIQATSGRFTNTIVVGAHDTDISSRVSSSNYIANVRGWAIRGDGYAEFNSVRVVGDVYANNGYFRGDITGSSGTFSSNVSSATIDSGTITGANIRSRGSVPLIQINSTTYNKVLFWSQLGEGVPADIRAGEAADDNTIQIYSADFGGGRSHISVGGAQGGRSSDINLVAGGVVFASAGQFRMAGGNITCDNAVLAGNGGGNTWRVAIGSFAGNEGFMQGQGTSNTGVRLGADGYVRIVTADGNSYTGLSAGNTSINGTLITTGYIDPGLLPPNGGFTVTATGTGPYRLSRASSTLRYKTNIENFEIDVEKVLALEPKTWNPKEGYGNPGDQFVGLVAEEVVDAIPHSGFYDKDNLVENYQDRAVLAGLLAVMKQQDARIKELEARL